MSPVGPAALDFTGLLVDELFVGGYGIDYAERCRYLPYLGTVETVEDSETSAAPATA